MTRITRLVDLNPKWRTYDGKDDHASDAIEFDCPEGHANCTHIIPFTPALDGSVRPVQQRNGAQWARRGDTFETLVLAPSIRRIPRYQTRDEAIAAGCIPHLISDSMLCAFHGFVGGSSGQTPGIVEFCGDSR